MDQVETEYDQDDNWSAARKRAPLIVYADILKQAAEDTLEPTPLKQKQPVISKEMWQIMEDKSEAFNAGDNVKAEFLNKKLSSQGRLPSLPF